MVRMAETWYDLSLIGTFELDRPMPTEEEEGRLLQKLVSESLLMLIPPPP